MIGIVGGVGPLAGLDIFRKIIEATAAACDQDHLPVILHSLPGQIPDRTDYLLGKVQENPGYPISRIILQLEKAGATVCAIPCNTAHAQAIFDIIKKELSAHQSRMILVSLIEATVAFVKAIPDCQSVGVLSTTGTKKEGIYRKPLQDAGFTVLEPDDEEQEKVHEAIYHPAWGVKAQSSPVNRRVRKILEHAASRLIERGAGSVIMGCTEIPLALTKAQIQEKTLIDPNKVLALTLIENYLNLQQIK